MQENVDMVEDDQDTVIILAAPPLRGTCSSSSGLAEQGNPWSPDPPRHRQVLRPSGSTLMAVKPRCTPRETLESLTIEGAGSGGSTRLPDRSRCGP